MILIQMITCEPMMTEKKNRNLLLTAAPLGDPNGDRAADAAQTAVNTIIIII